MKAQLYSPFFQSERITIQSMTNTQTKDVETTILQVTDLVAHGADAVRVSTANPEELTAFCQIVSAVRNAGLKAPLIADIHFNPLFAEKACSIADKVRINPGNYLSARDLNKPESIQLEIIDKRLSSLADACKQNGTWIRIGVNQGSVYGVNRKLPDAEGMACQALQYVDLLAKHDFHKVMVSLKSSDPWTVLAANRKFKELTTGYSHRIPIHLGVTESGSGVQGRVRSTIGIGLCLMEHMGDTIRVSLTEDPVKEIPVAREIIRFASKHDRWIERMSKISPNQSITAQFDRPVLVHDTNTKIPSSRRWIGDYKYDQTDGTVQYLNAGSSATSISDLRFFSENPDQLILKDQIQQSGNPSNVLVCEVHELETVLQYFSDCSDRPPILLKWSIKSLSDSAIVQTTLLFAPLFRHKIIQGVFLGSDTIDEVIAGGELFSEVLQACGLAEFSPNIISCPGCSRTTVELNELVKKLKAGLPENFNRRISIMGCAVNGYGELLESELGLIGRGNQRVDLYRRNERVKSNVPVTEAVDELIKMTACE